MDDDGGVALFEETSKSLHVKDENLMCKYSITVSKPALPVTACDC